MIRVTSPELQKTCRKCGETKLSSDFPRNARTRDRLSSWCRACHNAAVALCTRNKRVAKLNAEADELERSAAGASGWRARTMLSSARAIRREAELEAARGA